MKSKLTVFGIFFSLLLITYLILFFSMGNYLTYATGPRFVFSEILKLEGLILGVIYYRKMLKASWWKILIAGVGFYYFFSTSIYFFLSTYILTDILPWINPVQISLLEGMIIFTSMIGVAELYLHLKKWITLPTH